MSKPNVIKAIGISFLTVILLIAPQSAAAKTTIIKIATLAPDGSSYIQTLNDLNAELKLKTNNDVRLRIYPGGVLGDEKDMRRKMYVGQIHGAVLTSAGLSGIFSEMDVFQIPFLFENYDEVDYVVEKMGAFFKKGLKDKGYILLGWSEAGFIRLVSTHPIASLEDLRKAKVWTWEEAPMAKAIFDEAGVSAIPLTARCPGRPANRTGGSGIRASGRCNFVTMVHQNEIYDRGSLNVSDRRDRFKNKCIQ